MIEQGELRYKPFGSTRYTWGNTPTSYRYTGQREENALGLYYYGARWYDPGLGRFIQPDTIIPEPGDAKAYDRFAYSLNNPLVYTDPSGHAPQAIHDSNDGPAPSWTKWNDLYVTDPNRLYYEIVDWLQEHQDYNEITAMMETLASYANAMGGAGAAYEFQNVYGNAYATGQLAEVWGGEIYGGDPRFGYLAAGILTAGGLEPDRIASVGSPGDCSFSSDTLVTTDEGTKPIITLQVGDKVLAWNQSTGETDYYTVTATHNHLDPILVYLTIDGETILTTPEHPFYTVAGEWVSAGELEVGSRVYASNSRLGVITVAHVVEQPQVMYNLTVDQAHTFVVGNGQWLVHNQCPPYDRAAFGDWKPNVRQKVIARDGGKCVYCGSTEDLSVDHVVSLKQKWEEGAHSWTAQERNDWMNDTDNLVACCQRHNSQKGSMNPVDWLFGLFTGKYGD